MIAVLAVIGVGLCVAKTIAYSYTWTGNTSSAWDDYDNWTRAGCGSPCNEYPDDTGDDATISMTDTITDGNYTIDDLTITSGDVRIGPNSTGYCEEDVVLNVDSVTVSPSGYQPVYLRGGHCTTVYTN